VVGLLFTRSSEVIVFRSAVCAHNYMRAHTCLQAIVWRVVDAGDRVLKALVQAHTKVVSAIDRKLQREEGLGLSSYQMLERLAEAPNSTIGEAAEAVALSRSHAGRVVEELTRAGFVSRRVSTTDERVALVELTESGRDLLGRAKMTYLALVEQHFGSRVSRQELVAVADALEQIGQASSGNG
jgi:DNA-binding MarR family transcriptional regulator